MSQGEEISYADPSVYLPLLSAAFYMKHKISKTILSHHLQILNLTLKSSIKELNSPYTLLNKYQHLKSDIKKSYICANLKYSVILIEKDGCPLEKQPCGHSYSKHHSCCILTVSLERQVRYFIEHHGLVEPKESNENVCGDIHLGDYYKEYKSRGLINERTITLQLNADGAQCFKKSKFGIWPLMGIVNEATYKARRSHVFLMALWFGNKKPPRDAFLMPTINQLNELLSRGIMVGDVTYQVRPLIISVDTIARPILRNTTQFNGKHGCDFCLHPGK